MLIGIDTCVLVYFVDKGNPYHEEAKAALGKLMESGKATITPQNLSGIKGYKLFDTFLAATYLSNGITTIYTYNTKDFERLGAIRVWKP